MNIEQNWKDLNGENDADLMALLQPGQVQQIQSGDALLRIKKTLLMNTAWSIFFSAGYIAVLIFFPHVLVLLTIGIFLIFTAWGGYTAYRLYKSIELYTNGQQPLLQQMERYYNNIRGWIKFQRRFSIVAFPVGCVGGMFTGFLLFSKKPLDETLQRPGVIMPMIVLTILLVSAGWWLERFLTDKAFGEHLRLLKKNIDALKAVE